MTYQSTICVELFYDGWKKIQTVKKFMEVKEIRGGWFRRMNECIEAGGEFFGKI